MGHHNWSGTVIGYKCPESKERKDAQLNIFIEYIDKCILQIFVLYAENNFKV